MGHRPSLLTLARGSAGALLALLGAAGLIETVMGGAGSVLGVGLGGALAVALVAAWVEPARRPNVKVLGRRMVLAAWCYLAVIGGAVVSGAGGVLVGAAMAACWVGCARSRSGRAGGDLWQRVEMRADDRAGGPASLRAFLRNLDDEALLRIWESSRLAMGHAEPSRRALQVARVREHLLDEVERRDPDAFHAWLDTGARTDWPARPG